MSTTAFRLSTYLTLAASCACLGYAEAGYSSAASAIAGVVVLLLFALFHAEERLPLLSIAAANRVGLGLSVLAVLWLAYATGRTPTGSAWRRFSPGVLLPALGPVLLVLMPAKLLRREKHVGDYWTLHGCAVVAVGLAAAMSEDGVCFVLAAGYAVLAVWSLTLFFLARAGGAVPPVPNPAAPPRGTVEFADGRAGRPDLLRGAIWTGIAAAVAFPLFFVTPRSAAAKLGFGSNRIEVGYAADHTTDLNRTGDLKTNAEIAFEVAATELDGRPREGLNPEQRWRGTTLADYTFGVWKRKRVQLPEVFNKPSPGPWPPNVGADRFLLTFAVPPKLRDLPTADPVRWAPGEPPPVASILPGGLFTWVSAADGTFFQDPKVFPAGEPRGYAQVVGTADDADLGTAYELRDELRMDELLEPLMRNTVPRVKVFADDLREALIAEGKLPAAAAPRAGANDVRLGTPEEHHEAIARAFAHYLSTAPEFTYTTELRRDRRTTDPIEEFLFATKAGHCERFASALVLMLRSQGISSHLVLGFKGVEDAGGGNYVVRQEHAHAWAEALIPRRTADGRRVWHWLSLDPTPARSNDAANQAAAGDWWARSATWLKATFRALVVDYTPEQRRAAIRSAVVWLAQWPVLAVLGLAVGAGVLRRRSRRAMLKGEPPPDTGWFGKLLAVLAAHGYSPAPGDTPLEFASTVSDELRRRGQAAALAGVPLEWVEAYYPARFGGEPLGDARRAELERRLEELRAALAAT